MYYRHYINREECVIIEHIKLARESRAYNKINIMFFTRASHDHGSGTAYDRHYWCIGAAEWTESKWTVSGKSLQSIEVVIKAIIAFSCVQYVEK